MELLSQLKAHTQEGLKEGRKGRPSSDAANADTSRHHLGRVMNVSEHFEHSIVVAWQPLHLKPQLKVNEGVIWVMLNYAIKPNHFPLSFIMQDHVTHEETRENESTRMAPFQVS